MDGWRLVMCCMVFLALQTHSRVEAVPETLQELLNSAERILDTLHEKTQEAIVSRCDASLSCACSTSVCTKTIPDDYTCTLKLGDKELCSNCTDTAGRLASSENSFVQVTTSKASGVLISPGFGLEDLCLSRALDPVFQKMDRENDFGFLQHFASFHSDTWRRYPGIIHHAEDGGCFKSPALGQSMFISAATGYKQVIFLVDQSVNLQEKLNSGLTAADITSQLIENLVFSLSDRDLVNYVSFNYKPSTVFDKPLVVATSENKRRIIEEVQRSGYGGGANVQAGVTEAMRLFRNFAQESGPDCFMKVVFFLTSGFDDCYKECAIQGGNECRCGGELAATLEQVNNEIVAMGNNPVRFLVFEISDVDHTPTSLLASCAGEGLMFRAASLPDLESSQLDVVSYLATVARSTLLGSNVWTDEVELRGLDVGTQVAVSRTLYVNWGDDIPKIFGSVAVSIPKDIITSYNGWEDELERRKQITQNCEQSFVDPDCTYSLFRSLIGESDCNPRETIVGKAGERCFTFGERVFTFFDKLLGFEEAADYCSARGGWLAKVENRDVDQLVGVLGGYNGIWVGVRSADGSQGGYRYVKDNSEVPQEQFWNNPFWAVGEPEKPSTPGARCVAVDGRAIYYHWSTHVCHVLKRFVCEFDSAVVNEAGKCGIPQEELRDVEVWDGARDDCTAAPQEPLLRTECPATNSLLEAIRGNDREANLESSKYVCQDAPDAEPLSLCKKTCCNCKCEVSGTISVGAILGIVSGAGLCLVLIALMSLGIYLIMIAPRRKEVVNEL